VVPKGLKEDKTKREREREKEGNSPAQRDFIEELNYPYSF